MANPATSFFSQQADLENGLFPEEMNTVISLAEPSPDDGTRSSRTQRLSALQRGDLPDLGTLPSTEGSVDSEFEALADALLDRQLAGEDISKLLGRYNKQLADSENISPLDEDEAALGHKSGFISRRSRNIEVFWTTKRIKETIAIALVSLLVLVFLVSLFVKLFETF